MADDAETLPNPEEPALGLLDAAEVQLSRLDKGFDPDGLTALRTLISTYPDMGAPGAGEVAASLFMLLGRFVAGRRCDGEAIRVHLQAWRLMLVSGPHPEGGEQLRAGLKAIRDLYEAAEAA